MGYGRFQTFHATKSYKSIWWLATHKKTENRNGKTCFSRHALFLCAGDQTIITSQITLVQTQTSGRCSIFLYLVSCCKKATAFQGVLCCCVQEIRRREAQDLAGQIRAHRELLKAAKPRIDKSQLASLGAQFAERMAGMAPATEGYAAQVCGQKCQCCWESINCITSYLV